MTLTNALQLDFILERLEKADGRIVLERGFVGQAISERLVCLRRIHPYSLMPHACMLNNGALTIEGARTNEEYLVFVFQGSQIIKDALVREDGHSRQVLLGGTVNFCSVDVQSNVRI
jgi:hypothetical protein